MRHLSGRNGNHGIWTHEQGGVDHRSSRWYRNSHSACFAAEGAHLALLDIHERNLYELAGGLRNGSIVVSISVADLATWEGVERGIEEVLLAHGGRIDLPGNNVGVGVPRSFDQTTDDDRRQPRKLNFI